ncbi:MAG TPA: ABC transporter substrate-binding protein [Gemmatimonadales bacterium]|nr:ABC transporter substrate-binding protein [Gemmatimonadales bacterium]
MDTRLRWIVLATLAVGSAAARPAPRAPQAPERVVCVSKQLNEFLFAIGAQDVLVGRDLTSVYPPEIHRFTSVGYHRALSAEGIISLRPTLFLNDGNYGPAAVTEQLRAVGIPMLTLDPGNTVDSAQAILAELGRRFHREAAADSVIAAWRRGMGEALGDTLRWASLPRPRVLIMHFGQIFNDYLALKRGSVGDQMLRWAGAENAIDSVGGMMRLTPELIARAAPDIIVATDVGFDRLGSVQKFAAMPGVSLTPAARDGRIYRIEETDVMYYGPRTPEAIRRLASFFHPRATSR